MAKPHGLAPLMFRHLSDLDSPGVPSFVLDELRIAFERTTRRGLSLLRELFDLLDVFEAHQIPAVPYKGPVLAQQLYGHPGLRPCYDLDILVRPCDVSRVIELLVERHYRPLERLEPLEDESSTGATV